MTHPNDTREGPNPSGLCQCGCGQRTPISQYNDPRSGTVRGCHVRYIKGHGRRDNRPFYIVDPETGCWNWNLSMRGNGYGRICVNLKIVPAHRYMYERLKGPIPDGLQIDHLCKNTRCVNPDHMEPVTNTENMRRRDATKLTVDQARAILERVRSGVARQTVADQFGVSVSTVHAIMSRQRWADVSEA